MREEEREQVAVDPIHCEGPEFEKKNEARKNPKPRRNHSKLTTSLVPFDAPSFRVRSLTKNPGGRVIPVF